MIYLSKVKEASNKQVYDWLNNEREKLVKKRLQQKTTTKYCRTLERADLLKSRFDEQDITIFGEARKFYRINQAIMNDEYYYDMIQNPDDYILI